MIGSLDFVASTKFCNINTYIVIYIYIEREREGDREIIVR